MLLPPTRDPRTDGLVERTNRTLISALELLATTNPESWDLYLDYVAMSYRTRVNSSTGLTPHELVFGRVSNLFANYSDEVSASSATPESLVDRAMELRQLLSWFTQPLWIDSRDARFNSVELKI